MTEGTRASPESPSSAVDARKRAEVAGKPSKSRKRLAPPGVRKKPSPHQTAAAKPPPPPSAKPAPARKPAAASKTAPARKPAAASKPAHAAKPAPARKPAVASKTAPARKPAAASKPAPARKPTAAAKPPRASKPAATAKPVRAGEPAAGAKRVGPVERPKPAWPAKLKPPSSMKPGAAPHPRTRERRPSLRTERRPANEQPSPIAADVSTQRKLTCSIFGWRNERVGAFYALASGLQGHEWIVERSPQFEWLGRNTPAEAYEAHEILVDTLLRAGWRSVGSEGEWYRQRFERPFGSSFSNG